VLGGIEQGLDVEQVKAMRMALAGQEGASAMGQQTAAWVAEVEIIEAKLVELQARLVDKMSDVARGARRSTEAMGEFMKPLLEEASLLGYRKAQLEAISAMLRLGDTAKTITDQQLLTDLTERFAEAAEKMRHLVEQAKSLAEVSDDVEAMKSLIDALQAPLNQLDQQGLLDAFPTELKMREWLGDTFDVREILEPDRLYPDVGSAYRDYSGIDVKKLPLWMRQAENSWQELSAAYDAALKRGHGWSVTLDEWQQRQALAGGVLLSKDSPFVRLEATMRGGVWQRGGGARGGAQWPKEARKAHDELNDRLMKALKRHDMEGVDLTEVTGAELAALPDDLQAILREWDELDAAVAAGVAPTVREVAAEAVTPPAGGPVWRDLAGHKKGDAYELVADLNASEGVMLVSRPGVGKPEPNMFRIRRSKGKAGGWSVWYKHEGMKKFAKVAGGGNVRVPSKSNPDKTQAVPGVWKTLEDAKAHVDSLVDAAPTAREVAAEAVTPPPAAAGGVPAELRVISWDSVGPGRVLAYNAEAGRALVIPPGADFGNPKQNVSIVKLHEGTTFADPRYEGRIEHYSEGTRQVWRDRGFTFADEAAEAVTPRAAARDPFADTRPRISREEGNALIKESPARPTDPQPGFTEADALELEAVRYDMRGGVVWRKDRGGSYVPDMRPVVKHPNVRTGGQEPYQISFRIRKEGGTWNVYVLKTPMEFQEFSEGAQALARRLEGVYAHQAFQPTVRWGPNRPAPWEQLFPRIGDAGSDGPGFRTLRDAKASAEKQLDMLMWEAPTPTLRTPRGVTAEAVTPPPATAGRIVPGRAKIIASCTKGKCSVAEGATVAAEDLYTGPGFRAVREAVAEGDDVELAGILSAEHGLLEPLEQVGTYDRELTGALGEIDRLVGGPEKLQKFVEMIQLSDGGLPEELVVVGTARYQYLVKNLLERAEKYAGRFGFSPEEIAAIKVVKIGGRGPVQAKEVRAWAGKRPSTLELRPSTAELAEAVTPPPAAAETARSISDPDLLDPGGALRRQLGIPTDRPLYETEMGNLQELVDANAALRAARGTGRGVGVPPSERLAPSATSRMYGPSGPLYEQAIVRTPFGDFLLEFTGKKTARTVKILQGPEGLESWPAKTGPRVSTTRAPLGPGISFKDYDEAVRKIDNWAQEVFENRWTGMGDVEQAQGAVGRALLDPARQGGRRQALATLTGRTETTGFYGVEGLAWLDAPMWQLPVDLPDSWKVLTEAERELLTDAERLTHLAYASEHYRTAQAAMAAGLDVEAQIATMQGRIRQLYAERDIAKGEYAAVRAAAAAAKEAGKKGVREDVAPKLYDGTRNDIDEFQAGLRKFNAARTRDLFGKALTEQTAAQWGPNTANPRWSRGWTAPLQNEDEATPLFEMLNALFKTTSTTGDFSGFLKWYDKFLNYWKAQAVSTPGFVLRNGLGGSWLSYAFGLMELGSTNKFAGTYFRAMRSGNGDAVAGIDGMIDRLLAGKKKTVGVGFGARVDVNELRTIKRVLESGIVGGGQVITEVDRSVAMRLFTESRNPLTGNPIDVVFNPASTEFAPFRFIRSSNEQMETVLRGALAFDVLQKGGSIGDAAGQVYKFHFNYADLTGTERKMRRIIPFWTWQKNVVPILVESLGKHPYAWGRLQQVKGNLELQSKEEGVVPDYFLENMAVRLPWKINDYQSYWIPDLPFRDLNRLLKEPTSITRVFAESAAPPVKVPLEIWAGKQFFADLPFSGRYQQVPHVYDKFPFLMQALDLAGKAKKNKKGEYKMRDQDLYMLDSWMPFLSRFRRMLPNEKRYSRRVASTVVSTVFGTQVRINDPHETRNQMIRNDRAFDEKMRDIIDIEMRVR